MAAYNFDDSNIKWNRLGDLDLEHLYFSILSIDEPNYIIDILFKFDANEKIILHRHMVHNTFVGKASIGSMNRTAGSRRSARSAATDRARPGMFIAKAAVPTRTS